MNPDKGTLEEAIIKSLDPFENAHLCQHQTCDRRFLLIMAVEKAIFNKILNKVVTLLYFTAPILI